MANFIIAYNKTAKNEGGYSNDPADRGGETWKGIAREMHPGWKGWVIVDKYRMYPDFIKRLHADSELHKLELEFYKQSFWDKIRGDEIAAQEIADEVYDMAVNKGPTMAILLLQRSMKYLPQNGLLTTEFLNKINNK
jgi:lysozyme family protein